MAAVSTVGGVLDEEAKPESESEPERESESNEEERVAGGIMAGMSGMFWRAAAVTMDIVFCICGREWDA